jgi:uncharacterized protein YacL
MLMTFMRLLVGLLGATIGYGLSTVLEQLGLSQMYLTFGPNATTAQFIISLSIALIFFLVFLIVSPWILKQAIKLAKATEKELQKIPFTQMVTGTIGLIIGLLIAFLLSGLLRNLLGTNIFSGIISFGVYGLFVYLGMSMAIRNLTDLSKLPDLIKRTPVVTKPAKHVHSIPPKILDTSVIIDGRVADICQTGFIEGSIIIPEFVLEELRHIADSSDGLKRNRGRRGLDILNRIQKELKIEVKIVDIDFEDVQEVDIKLIKLAKQMDGFVVTNDFNLNKVAELHGVRVLNINELANAVKPVVLPGEEMVVLVVKEGKENKQGLAYLDDGTMIVVEEGRRYMNETIEVVVTSVLQTSAGRMIFAKSKV